jgi:hypothetical protein
VFAQLVAVRAESIGFQQFGPGLHEIAVDAQHQVWPGQVQFVKAGIDRHAVRVQGCAHGPIGQERWVLQETL